MALLVTENGAYDVVNSNSGTGGTTITVTTAALWPDPATVGPYGASVWPTTVPYTNDTGERVVVTGKSGAVLTVVRAQGGTTAKTIAINWQIAKGWGAEDGRAALWTPDRNLLYNPGFAVCQRGSSYAIASVATGNYGADGWYHLNQSNPVSYTRFTPSNAPIASPYTGVYKQLNATAQRFGALQAVEYLRSYVLRGEPIRLDFMAGASTTLTLRFAVLCWTGTLDAANKNVVSSWTSTNYTAGNFFIASDWNITAVGSLSIGTTPVLCSLRATAHASTNNIAVLWWTETAAAQNVEVGVSDFMLAPEAQWRPYAARDAQRELELCQRYYEKSYSQATAPGNAAFDGLPGNFSAGGSDFFSVNPMFQVTKRIAPTVSYWDSAGNASKITELTAGAGTTANVTPSIGLARVTDRSFEMVHDPAGSILGLRFGYAATAEL